MIENGSKVKLLKLIIKKGWIKTNLWTIYGRGHEECFRVIWHSMNCHIWLKQREIKNAGLKKSSLLFIEQKKILTLILYHRNRTTKHNKTRMDQELDKKQGLNTQNKPINERTTGMQIN